MVNLLKKWAFLLLMTTIGYAKVPNDTIVINRAFMSNILEKIIFDEYLPGKDIETFTDKDKGIFYYIYLGVINPTKEKYQIEIICVDNKNNVIFKKSTERKLMEYSNYIGEDLLKNQDQIFKLNTKLGAMVEGQVTPLKDGNMYFIKLYIEKKLMGVSMFSYHVIS